MQQALGGGRLVKETFPAPSWVSAGHHARVNCGDSSAPPPTKKGSHHLAHQSHFVPGQGPIHTWLQVSEQAKRS